MEHFDEKLGMKKKSLYTFHLDTPRVIIAVSVFLGVVALTFLLGMTFTKGDKAKPESLTVSDLLAADGQDLNRPPQVFQSQNEPEEVVQPEPQVSSQIDAGSELIASNRPMNNNDSFSPFINDTVPAAEKVAINNPPKNNPPKREKPAEKKKENKETNNKSKTVVKANAAPDSRNIKKDAASTTKKKSVVAPVVNESKNSNKGSFAVQVASYDKRTTAVNEIEYLKKLSYNAYMNDTLVDGKRFFRVRIGPLSSRERAAAILDEVQDYERYASSYIVKE